MSATTDALRCDYCDHLAHCGWTCGEMGCRCDKGESHDDDETCDTCGRSVDDHDMRSLSDACQDGPEPTDYRDAHGMGCNACDAVRVPLHRVTGYCEACMGETVSTPAMVRAFYWWNRRYPEPQDEHETFGCGLYGVDGCGEGECSVVFYRALDGRPIGPQVQVFGDALVTADSRAMVTALLDLIAGKEYDSAEAVRDALIAAGWQDWTHRGELVLATVAP